MTRRLLFLALLPAAFAYEIGTRALAAAVLLPFDVLEELKSHRRRR